MSKNVRRAIEPMDDIETMVEQDPFIRAWTTIVCSRLDCGQPVTFKQSQAMRRVFARMGVDPNTLYDRGIRPMCPECLDDFLKMLQSGRKGAHITRPLTSPPASS